MTIDCKHTSVVLHKSFYIKISARRQCCHSRGSNRESIVLLKQIKPGFPLKDCGNDGSKYSKQM